MARSFSEIGATIFDFFFDADNKRQSIDVASSAGNTSFAVSRQTTSDDTVESTLSVTREMASTAVSAITVTCSDFDNPSVELVSKALQSRNVSLSTKLCDPQLSLALGYNDQKRYAADLAVDADITALAVSGIEASVACDGLLSRGLVMGAKACAQPLNNEQDFALGLEYKVSDSLSVGVSAVDSLKAFELGLRRDALGGNAQNSLFGKVRAEATEASKTTVDGAIGFRRAIDEQTSLDVLLRADRTMGVRYQTTAAVGGGSSVRGFIATNLNFNDAQERARMQYGLTLE